MKIKKAHCLFEQSGTFKNEFRKLGIDAEDYDIQNEFGETDHVIDLFSEIEGGYDGEPSIFDNMGKDDLIIAFFPCIRFEEQIILWYKGQSVQIKDKWTIEQKLENDIKLHTELDQLYKTITMLTLICYRKGLRLIIENPYSEQHYLHRYWALEPKLIDKNRLLRGDYFKKPTQYFFVNCEPEKNFIFEPQVNNYQGTIIKAKIQGKSTTTSRSMISPEYANRFIREQILDEEQL